MPRFVGRLFVALVAGPAALGCGGDAGPVPVRGVVRLDGQPVANAAVVFVAQQPPHVSIPELIIKPISQTYV